jgi:hypothetical protein
MKVIMITPDSAIKEIEHEDIDKIKGSTVYSGASLLVPEIWQYNKYKLSILMKDTFNISDGVNMLATMLYNRLLIEDYEHNDVVKGTVFICNESKYDSDSEADDEADDEIIDFTYKDITYIMRCLQQQI